MASPGGDSAPHQISADAADRDGRFAVEVAEEQVLLTVHAPHGKGRRIDRTHVLQTLKTRGIAAFDEAKVDLVVNLANGEAVMIGLHHESVARAEVEVTEDGLEAHILLTAPPPGGKDVDRRMIEGAVKAAGVVHGLLADAVTAMVEKRAYGVRRVIARGTPPKPGKDGRVALQFDREAKGPAVDEETGRVDHRELGKIINVHKGDLLAVIEPPGDGAPGKTVKGNVISATKGHPASPPDGRNVEVSADGKEFRAAADGQVEIIGGAGHEKINVNPVFEVKGSVNAETGNIHFVGSVVIKDGVEDGYVVEAGEDITIGGVVEKAVVKAGRDVTIRGGILGKREGTVTAGGTIRTQFIQEGNVDAGGDVFVENYALHSMIEGDRVLVGGDGKGSKGKRKGLLMGGSVRATREVACTVLGSPNSTKTDIQVGLNPKLARRLEELTKQLESDKETFEKVRKGLTVLDAIKEKLGAIPPEKAEIHSSLLSTQDALQTRLTQMAEELRDLHAQSQRQFRAKISVAGETHPGVKIMIRNEAYYVTKENNYTTYVLDDGKVRPVPYEAPKLVEKPDHEGKKPAKEGASGG